MNWPTPYLFGNSQPCPSCAEARAQQDLGVVDRESIACDTCGGRGLLQLHPADIVTATLKDRDAIEARRLEAARGIATEIRKRLGGTESPFDLRDVVRGRGLATTVRNHQIRIAGHQISVSINCRSARPTRDEMRAALRAWADAAECAMPRNLAVGG